MASPIEHAATLLSMVRRAETEEPEDEASEMDFFMGVLFAFLGSTLQAIGLGVMKLQYNTYEKEEEERLTVERRLTIEGNVGDISQVASDGPVSPGSVQSPDRPNGTAALPHTGISSIPEKEENAAEPGAETSPAGVKPEIVNGSAANFGQDAQTTDNAEDVISHQRVLPHDNSLHTSARGDDAIPGQLQESLTSESGKKPLCARIPWIWVTGFTIFIIGNVGDFYALGITNQSVVPLVGSWTLVVTLGVARFLLKEEINWWDILACVFIMTGISLTVVFGTRESEEWELPELLARYEDARVQILLALLAAIVVGGLTIMHLDHVKRKKWAKEHMEVVRHAGRFVGTLYCLTGATVACFTVLFGKAFSGLLFPLLLENENNFTSPWASVIVVAFIISLPSQMYLIHSSLKVNAISFHIPTFYVLWNIGSIVTSAIYYEEMDNFETRNYIGFLGGAFILFIGCYFTNVAAGAKARKEAEKEKELPDPLAAAGEAADGRGGGAGGGDARGNGNGNRNVSGSQQANGNGSARQQQQQEREAPLGKTSASVGLADSPPSLPRDAAAAAGRAAGGAGVQGAPYEGSEPWRPHTAEPRFEPALAGPEWTPFQPPVSHFSPPYHPLRNQRDLFAGGSPSQPPSRPQPPLLPPAQSLGPTAARASPPTPLNGAVFLDPSATAAFSFYQSPPAEPSVFAPGPYASAGDPQGTAGRYQSDYGVPPSVHGMEHMGGSLLPAGGATAH